jgi:hypothetical protein
MRERREWWSLVPGVTVTVTVAGGLALLVMSVFGAWPWDAEGLNFLAGVAAIFAVVGVWFFLRSRRLARLANTARRALPLEDGGFTPPDRVAELRRMHRWRVWVLNRPALAAVVRGLALLCGAAVVSILLWRLRHDRPEPLLSLVAWALTLAGNLTASLTDRKAQSPPPAPTPRRPFSFP